MPALECLVGHPKWHDDASLRDSHKANAMVSLYASRCCRALCAPYNPAPLCSFLLQCESRRHFPSPSQGRAPTSPEVPLCSVFLNSPWHKTGVPYSVLFCVSPRVLECSRHVALKTCRAVTHVLRLPPSACLCVVSQCSG